MSRFRTIIAAAIAAFLLLTLLDRFKLIELLIIRTGLPLVVALAEAVAIAGAGFAVRGLRGRVWRVHGGSGALDLPLDFVIGYPIFGTLCFLVATLRIANWTMLPLLVIAMLFGAYAVARWREQRQTADSRQQTADGGRQTADSRQRTADGGRQTADSRQQTADGGRQTADSRQQTADGGRQTADSRQQTADGGRQTADSRRQTTDGRQQTADGGEQTAESSWPAVRCLLSAVSLALVFLCAFVAAQAPPASLDELAYHLAIPKTWMLEGHAIALPLLSHSWFPLGIESADLPLLTLLGDDGATASHFVHLLAAIAVTVLIQRRAKNLLITAAIITTPALAITAGWSLVDFPLLGICVALWLALEDGDDATAAAAIGAGLLTKYTFVPFAIVALIAARRWRPAIPGLLIGSIFFIRNLILAGNPVAPFLAAAAPLVAHYRGGAYLSDYVFAPNFIDESLGAAMLMLAPLAAGAIPIALLACGIGLFILAPSSRLLVPFFAVPAMSAMADRRWVRWLLVIAITVQTAMVVYLTDRGGSFGLLAAESEQAFLAKQRPSYASIAWLNTALPEKSRTLVIGTGESFWFSHRVRAGGNFDSERISAWLDSPTPEALREKLRRDGITHIAVITVTAPPTQVVQKIEERQTLLTPAAQRSLSRLLDRYASSVAARGNATLFTLR
jgi:hypothetical protein